MIIIRNRLSETLMKNKWETGSLDDDVSDDDDMVWGEESEEL